MIQPIPGSLFRPLIGVITNKYKYLRSMFIESSIIIFVLVGLLWIISNTILKKEIDDLDVIKTPLFWLFFSTISLIYLIGMVKSTMENTIYMNLLGIQILY